MPQTIHRGIKSLIDEANAEIETIRPPMRSRSRKTTTS